MTLAQSLPAILALLVNLATVAYFIGTMRSELREQKERYITLETKIDGIVNARMLDAKGGGELIVRLEDFANTKRRTEENHDLIIRLEGRVGRIEEVQEGGMRRFEELFRGMSNLTRQVNDVSIPPLPKGDR
jgi:predicted RNase H-like nuclease (RuvC/YqgF family)